MDALHAHSPSSISEVWCKGWVLDEDMDMFTKSLREEAIDGPDALRSMMEKGMQRESSQSIQTVPARQLPDSSQTAPRQPPGSSQAAPREPPDSPQTAPRQLPGSSQTAPRQSQTAAWELPGSCQAGTVWIFWVLSLCMRRLRARRPLQGVDGDAEEAPWATKCYPSLLKVVLEPRLLKAF